MSFIATLAGILLATQLVSHLFARWGIPDVIGQILVGVVAGPAMLNWVHQTEMINEFQEIGVIILMFIAGLESDLNLLKKYLKPAVVVALMGMILPVVVMGLASDLFGMQWFESLFVGVIFFSYLSQHLGGRFARVSAARQQRGRDDSWCSGCR